MSESEDSHLQVGLDSIPKEGVPEHLALDYFVDFLSTIGLKTFSLPLNIPNEETKHQSHYDHDSDTNESYEHGSEVLHYVRVLPIAAAIYNKNRVQGLV